MQTDETMINALTASSEFAHSLLSPSHLSDMRTPLKWRLPDSLNIGYLICGRWAEVQPERTALIHLNKKHEKQSWSYGRLDTASRKLASALKALNINPHDRIALMLPQAPETIISHVASAYCEAISVPLFTLFGTEALAFRLADSATSIVVTDEDGITKLQQISARCPALKTILVVRDTNAPLPQIAGVSILDFWEALEGATALHILPRTGKDQPAIMIYTSGTTGSPKGALHAHRFLLGHLPNIEISHNGFPKSGDVAWTPADWAWIGGLMDLAMPALFYGVVLISHRMRKFDPEFAFQMIAELQIKNMFLPPTALKMMKHYSASNPLPEKLKIRSIASGGEALPASVTRWAQAEFGVSINEIYGQTECNLVICTNRAHQNCPDGFMGMAVAGHHLAILDAEGKTLAPGDIGQIAVKADHPVTFLEYWKQPHKTAEKFHQEWLLTGDLGVVDTQGNCKFISRDDDVISSAGYRIGPTEIENCLLSHEEVSNAAVIGLKDALRGEAITAILVPAHENIDKHAVAEELIQLVRTALSPHMAPRQIFWANTLPMTTTGKIMRRELRAAYAQKEHHTT